MPSQDQKLHEQAKPTCVGLYPQSCTRCSGHPSPEQKHAAGYLHVHQLALLLANTSFRNPLSVQLLMSLLPASSAGSAERIQTCLKACV